MSRRRKEAPLSSPRCWMWNRWLGSLGLVVRKEGRTWRQLERQKRRGRKGEGTSSGSVLALLQRQCLLEEGEKFLPLFNSPFALFSAASFAVVFPLFFLRWRHQDGRSWRRGKRVELAASELLLLSLLCRRTARTEEEGGRYELTH